MFLRLVVYWEEYCPFVNFIIKVSSTARPGEFLFLVLKLKFRFFFKKSFLQHPLYTCIYFADPFGNSCLPTNILSIVFLFTTFG